MAWALQLDGANDFCTIEETSIPQGEDGSVRILFRLSSTATARNVFGNIGNNNSIFRVANTMSSVLVKPESGVGHTLNYITPLVIDTWYDYTLTKTNGVWDVIDTQTQSSVLTGASSVDDTEMKIHQLFRRRTKEYFHGDVQILEVAAVSTTVNNRGWDATTSNHGAGTPVLVDTIGGNDATGVNMPTDGSAWIDLGGGSVIDVTTTLGAISYTSSDASVSVTGSVDVGATLGGIDYSSSSAIISLAGEFVVSAELGVINYTSSDATVSLAAEITINATLGSINYTSSNTAVELAGLIPVATTLGSITYDNYSATVSIGEGQFIGNVTAEYASDIYTAGFKPDTITVKFN